MQINLISLFPELIRPVFEYGVVGKAGLSHEFVDPREFTTDVHRTVDDRPFGGGDGMVMKAEPLAAAVESLEEPGHVILLTPHGKPLTDRRCRELSQLPCITLVCGRYAGVDQRFINRYIDEEMSIGDYILSGGELAAAVVIDAVARQIPGVLGHQGSKDCDSFADGLLEAPSFTQPREALGQKVPEVLTSGNHALIDQTRQRLSYMATLQKRPDLLSDEQRSLAETWLADCQEREIWGLK